MVKPVYLTNLSALRIFFATGIVFFHLPAWTQLQRSVYAEYLFFFNDGFFCLSGYLMFHIFFTRAQVSDWRKDVFKRFRTFYPLHFLMLCVWTLVSISESHLARFFGLEHAEGGSNSLMNFLKNLVFIQGWRINSEYSFNHPAWVFSALLLCYVIARLIFLTRNKLLVAAISVTIASISFAYMISSGAVSAQSFFIPRVFLGFFLGGIFGLMSRLFEPNRIIIVFFSLCSVVYVIFIFRYFGDNASFFTVPSICILIWLISRKRGVILFKPTLEARLICLDRLTFPLMITHSLPVILMEHLCILMFNGPTEKLRGTKYIELSNIQGLCFILTTFLLCYVFAALLRQLIENYIGRNQFAKNWKGTIARLIKV
jgi:peptidoglycan/LPS O-acetylase OafA/YrhL